MQSLFGRTARSACIGIALVLAAASAARADEAGDNLLAKHRAFVGWQLGDGALPAFTTEGTRRLGGTEDVRFRAVHAGQTNRETQLRASAEVHEFGYADGRYWFSDENGFTVPVFGETTKFLTARNIIFNEGTTLFGGTARGTLRIDDVKTAIVRIEPHGAYAIDLYVDPATGAYRPAVINPDGDSDAVDIFSYVDAGAGKKVIGAWAVDDDPDAPPAERVRWNVSKVTAGNIAASDLQPPPQVARWIFGSGASVPLEYRESRLIVEAKVNGVAGRFMIDTGADGVYLSSRFAKRADVREGQYLMLRGVDRLTAGRVGHIDTFEIGDSILQDATVVVDTDTYDDVAPDGLLGFSFFAGAVVKLDLDAGRLTLYDPAKPGANFSDGFLAQLDLTDGKPVVPMFVNGKIPVDAILDTGTPELVLISRWYLSKNDVKLSYDDKTSKMTLMLVNEGGRHAKLIRCGNLESLDFGALHFVKPLTCGAVFSDNEKSALLGMDYLAHFNFLIDYSRGRMLLSPRAAQK